MKWADCVRMDLGAYAPDAPPRAGGPSRSSSSADPEAPATYAGRLDGDGSEPRLAAPAGPRPAPAPGRAAVGRGRRVLPMAHFCGADEAVGSGGAAAGAGAEAGAAGIVALSLASHETAISRVRWPEVVAITRSRAGVHGGVYFVLQFGGETAVIKPGYADRRHVLASSCLRHAGFVGPRLEVWPRGGGAFAQLCHTLERIGCDRGSPVHDDAGREVDFVMCLDFVEGSDLTLRAPQSAGWSSHVGLPVGFWEQLGRLVVFDTLMGNDDRIGLERRIFNRGNVMYRASDGGLSPIDQACPLFFEERSWSPDARRARRALIRIRQQPRHVAESIVDLVGAPDASRGTLVDAVGRGLALGCRQVSDGHAFGELWRRVTDDAERLGIHVGQLSHLMLPD